jgi:glycerol-3-phosphate dehydrogenase
LSDAVVMTRGSRILFAIPWGERMILGTTDTDYAGPLGTPTCDQEDIRYVLEVTNGVFPEAGLTSEDVIATWAGLRPLIANGEESGTPSDTSRSHSIKMAEPGWIDVVGGKLTTYRLMAEQAVDKITAHLDRETEPCQTAESPLLAASALHGSGIIPPEVSREQVEHYCRNEWAIHLDDVMIRRSSWAYYHKDSAAIARDVAGWMSEIYQWDQQQRDEEMRRYRSALTYLRAGTLSAVLPREAIQA